MAAPKADFNKIIKDARERKKNEALAGKIFSRDRRQSAPSALKAAPGPSLASRVGVKKPQQQPKRASRASLPAGNVNGEWTHDLHNSLGSRSRDKTSASNSLSSRISLPGTPNTKVPNASTKRRAKLANALSKMAVDEVNIVNTAPKGPRSQQQQGKRDMGMTIRGLAGPFAVMAQNFAPGTTEADIESVMTPVGGEMVSCQIKKTTPLMVVEMVFASREGGERAIATFNDQTADGRIIKVYPKPGGSYQAPANTSRNGQNSSNDLIVDGMMGFDVQRNPNRGQGSRNSQPLYSDKLVAQNRRGGSSRGRGGR